MTKATFARATATLRVLTLAAIAAGDIVSFDDTKMVAIEGRLDDQSHRSSDRRLDRAQGNSLR